MTREEFDALMLSHGIVFKDQAPWRVAQMVSEFERDKHAAELERLKADIAMIGLDVATLRKVAAAIRGSMA